MSMTTTIKTKAGPKLRFVTEQYVVGLYLAVYKEGESIPEQTYLNVEQVKFHKDIRAAVPGNRDVVIKDESDPLNAKEVRDDQITFAGEYCLEHGWPLDEDGPDWFSLLTPEQVTEIRTQPEWEACKAKLVW